MTMYLAAPALVAIVGCVLVSEKSDLWGLVVDSANSMAHTRSSLKRGMASLSFPCSRSSEPSPYTKVSVLGCLALSASR